MQDGFFDASQVVYLRHSPSPMTFDDFKELCELRRSIRYFADTPIDRATLLKLIEVGEMAPNIQNTQPWHFHIVENRELKTKLSESAMYGNFVMGAGAFIIVSCNKDVRPSNREIIWNPREIEFSCVSAINFMMLAATSLGLGSCWVSLHHGAPHELLKLPMSHVIVGGLMVGHLKKGEETPGSGHDRKPIKEIYTIHE
jgi:nitroreductase